MLAQLLVHGDFGEMLVAGSTVPPHEKGDPAPVVRCSILSETTIEVELHLRGTDSGRFLHWLLAGDPTWDD